MKENFGQKWSRHSPKTPRVGASWSDLPLPLPLPRATGTLDSLCCKLVSCTSPPVFACITLVLIGRTRASITLDWNAVPPWISLPATPSARPRREVFKPGSCDATLDSLLDMTRVVIVDGRYNAVVRGLQHNILRCQKDKEKSICWKSIRFQTSSSVLQHCLHCFPRGVNKNSLAQSCGTPCMILFRFKQSAKQIRLPQIVISDNEGQAGKFLVIPFQRFHIIFMVPLCTSNIFDFAWQLPQSLIIGFHKQQLPGHYCMVALLPWSICAWSIYMIDCMAATKITSSLIIELGPRRCHLPGWMHGERSQKKW